MRQADVECIGRVRIVPYQQAHDQFVSKTILVACALRGRLLGAAGSNVVQCWALATLPRVRELLAARQRGQGGSFEHGACGEEAVPIEHRRLRMVPPPQIVSPRGALSLGVIAVSAMADRITSCLCLRNPLPLARSGSGLGCAETR